MVDEPDSLAFFRPTHYYVDAVGAVSDSDSDPGAGWEKVTKEELFKRWPAYRRIEERLLRKLADEGSA